MPVIEFISDAVEERVYPPEHEKAGQRYDILHRRGKRMECRESSARFWKNKGVAILADTTKPAAVSAPLPPAPLPPSDFAAPPVPQIEAPAGFNFAPPPPPPPSTPDQ